VKYNGKILGFVCKFCALLSFDLGPSPDIAARFEFVELPCAGRIDARAILAAFEQGADGVFVAGCPTHECMNLNGSGRAEKRIERVKDILDTVGLGRDRLTIYHVSGTRGPRVAQIAKDMAERLDRLGPSPLNIRKQGEGSCDNYDCSRSEAAAGNS
jgi:F420-non-reducing hydrogenase iron-sulfur subunit